MLLQPSLLTSVSPQKTGSKPLGATRGEPASKKPRLSAKETLRESSEDDNDSDDPIDGLKHIKRSTNIRRTYGHSRTIQRTASSLFSSPNNPSTTTTSLKKKKTKEIIDVDDSPPFRPRPKTKVKSVPQTDSTSEEEEEILEEAGGKPHKKAKPFPFSASGARTRSKSPSGSAGKGKGKVKDFPMETRSSRQVSAAISFPLSPRDDADGGDDTMMLGSPKRHSRPEAAPFPMTATQFGSPHVHRPAKQRNAGSDSQFSNYRSNDDEILSDSNAEKESLLPPGFRSPSSSKRRSSEPEDDSDLLLERRKRRKKGDAAKRTSSEISLLPASAREKLVSSPPPPSRLCPFCDEPLPQKISTRLKTLIESLVERSKAAPRPGNPLGRDAPLALSINVCAAHRAEAQTIPQGLKKGWPRTIDFKDLPRRMKGRSVRKALEAIVNAPASDRTSKFWIVACKDIRKRGARVANSVQGQMETFHLTQPGYYGEQGFLVISEALQAMFPQTKLEAAEIAPMDSQNFLRRVLVPETAILLIMEDMEQDYSAALKTMEDSREYGTALFPARDNDGDVSFDLTFKLDSPPKSITAPSAKPQQKVKGKESLKERDALQRAKRGQRSPVFSTVDSDEESEEEEDDLPEMGSLEKRVLARNSSVPSSRPSTRRDPPPKPLPKPSEIRKVSERRTDANSISSEREVQGILDADPGTSASFRSSSKGSSSLGNGQPKFIRPRAHSPTPAPPQPHPVPIPVPQPETRKPTQPTRHQPPAKKPTNGKGKQKGKNPSNDGPGIDFIELGRGKPLPSMNSNSQKHREAGGHHLEKATRGSARNTLPTASTLRIGLSRLQKVGPSTAMEGSSSTIFSATPKKPRADNVEILVDTPSAKMKQTYVRTPEHLFSKSLRKSPARFSKPSRRQALSKTKAHHIQSRDDDEPEDIDSDSGSSDLPEIGR